MEISNCSYVYSKNFAARHLIADFKDMSVEVGRIKPPWYNSKIMLSSIYSMPFSIFTPYSIFYKLEQLYVSHTADV